ncbi:hypothetical protein NT6N_21130 [Oceaniferula spumae]|uniref:Sialate O-acetylesterase domain-containing protein n=1 Tax=Oceaniferula spumae TaxID=2979115 RepID=A0AAT9FM82_9BACT
MKMIAKYWLFSMVASVALNPSLCSGAEYEIYLLAGQSNMDGRGKTTNLTQDQRQPSDSILIFYQNPPHTSAGWKPLTPGFSIPPRFKGKLPSPTFGPEIGFAAAMTEQRPNHVMAFIKCSKGGTNLRADWKPGVAGKPDTQGPCYRNLIATIKLATDQLTKDGHQYKLSGLLWHQGESDSKASAKVHQRRLAELIARIREDTGVKNLPWVVGEVFDNGKRDNVRAALRAVSDDDPACGLISSEGTTTWDEGTHFDAKSQLLLGQRYAQAMIKLIPEAEASPVQK